MQLKMERELMCVFPLRQGGMLMVMLHLCKELISIIAIIIMMRMKFDFLHNVQVCGLSQQTREKSVDLFEQSFSDMVWDPVQVFVFVKDGFRQHVLLFIVIMNPFRDRQLGGGETMIIRMKDLRYLVKVLCLILFI